MTKQNPQYIIELNGRSFQSNLELTMAYIGGKWKVRILHQLTKNKKRFSDLRNYIPDISERMLSGQLKALILDGLVMRTAYAEVPPRVEYELTEEGKTLIPVIEVLAAWGNYKADQGKVVESSSL